MNYNEMKMPELRKMAKEKGLTIQNTTKKADLIAMLSASCDDCVVECNKPVEDVKESFKLEIPHDIRDDLEKLSAKGLKWDFDVEKQGVYFQKDLRVFATLNQPSKGILQTARAAFGQRTLGQDGVSGDRGNRPVEWA